MIRLEGLQVQAGDFSLSVDDLSITPGEYVMVLGPTASGKTVLLETVAGLRRPQGGRVWFGSRDVTGEPPERRGAGLVYQDYALFPHLNVAQNIGFGLRPGRTQAAAGSEGRSRATSRRPQGTGGRVGELAGLLGIDGLLQRYPDGLSGGERQRVALARALAIEPEVLLLDEPLSALDGPTRLELQKELKRLQREFQATVMHVTHDLDEALTLGDRMAVLINGRLHQVGPPSEVIRHPADGDVALLTGVTNVFPIISAVVDRECTRIRLGGVKGGGTSGEVELIVASTTVGQLGGAALAIIRPEEIVLLSGEGVIARPIPEAGVLSENLLEGVVREIQLQSVHASLEIDVPPVFSVHVLRPDAQRMCLAAGSRVRLWIPPEVVHVCPV